MITMNHLDDEKLTLLFSPDASTDAKKFTTEYTESHGRKIKLRVTLCPLW